MFKPLIVMPIFSHKFIVVPKNVTEQDADYFSGQVQRISLDLIDKIFTVEVCTSVSPGHFYVLHRVAKDDAPEIYLMSSDGLTKIGSIIPVETKLIKNTLIFDYEKNEQAYHEMQWSFKTLG